MPYREGGASSDGDTAFAESQASQLDQHNTDDDDQLEHHEEQQRQPRRKASIQQMMAKSFRRVRNFVASNTNLSARKSSAVRKHQQQQRAKADGADETGAGSFSTAANDDIDGGESEAMLMHMTNNDAAQNNNNNMSQANELQQQKQNKKQKQSSVKPPQQDSTSKNNTGSNTDQQQKHASDSGAANDTADQATDHDAADKADETDDAEASANRSASSRRRWRRSLGASLFDILGMHYNKDKDANTADSTTGKTEQSAAQQQQQNDSSTNQQDDDNDLEDEGIGSNQQDKEQQQYDDTTSDRFFDEEHQQRQQQQQQQNNTDKTSQPHNIPVLREHPSEITTVSYAGEEDAAGRFLYDEDENEQQQRNADGSVRQDLPIEDERVQNQESEDNYLRISLLGDMEEDEEEENEGAGSGGSNDDELVEGAAFTEEAARENQREMLPAAGQVDFKQPQSLAELYGIDNDTAAFDTQDVVENAMLRHQSNYPANDAQLEHSTNFTFSGEFDPEAYLQMANTDVDAAQPPTFQRQQTTVHPNYTNLFDIANYEQLQQDEQDDLLLQQQQADAIDESELSFDFEYLTSMGLTAFSSELEPVDDYQFVQVFGMEREGVRQEQSITLQVQIVNDSGQVSANQNANSKTDEKHAGSDNAANSNVGNNEQVSDRTTESSNYNRNANKDEASEEANARQVGRALGDAVIIMESPEHTMTKKMHQNKLNFRDRRNQNASGFANNNNAASRQQSQQGGLAERQQSTPSAAGDIMQGGAAAAAQPFQAKNFPDMTVQQFADSVPWAAEDDQSATAGGDIDSSPFSPNSGNVTSNTSTSRQDNTATEAPQSR